MTNLNPQKPESGFALLLTLLVVTVLISIGLSILNLSIQQVQLATTARDSEVAFQAASGGMECAHYWRRNASTSMEAAEDDISIGCFGIPNTIDGTDVSTVTGGAATQYEYEFSWPLIDPDRCTQINTIVATSSPEGSDLVINDMEDLVPGYPDGDTKTCEAGTFCSVISVQGYNRPCNNITSFGTVQREVLLQL